MILEDLFLGDLYLGDKVCSGYHSAAADIELVMVDNVLKAYRVQDILVFADRGTEAKILAAPSIRPDEEWRADVAAWVALRAERSPEDDQLVDSSATNAYIHQS